MCVGNGSVGASRPETGGVAASGFAGSSLQRQAHGPEAGLDERERAERNRAGYRAHAIFASLVLIGVTYTQLSIDLAASGKARLWTPQSAQQRSALFWELFIAAVTLPAAVPAWTQAPGEPD